MGAKAICEGKPKFGKVQRKKKYFFGWVLGTTNGGRGCRLEKLLYVRTSGGSLTSCGTGNGVKLLFQEDM